VRIYSTTAGCAKNALVCTVTVNFHNPGLAGTISALPASGSGTVPTGATLTLSGRGPAVVTACPAPLDVLGGSTVTASNLQLTRH
jgi:hypothetical protein